MAVTVSGLSFSIAGNKRRTTGVITLDSSYPTGGETISPNLLGLGSIDVLSPGMPVNATPAMRGASYKVSTGKLLVFDDAFAEIANGVDLAGFSFPFEAVGY